MKTKLLFLSMVLVSALGCSGGDKPKPDPLKSFSFQIENVTASGVVEDPANLATEKSKAETAVRLSNQ